MKSLTDTQCAYFAGFLDADGCITAQIVRREDYVMKYQIRVSVTFFQTKQRIHFFQRFQKQIGAGTLRDRGDGIVELAIVGMKTVEPFLKQIQPFLILKQTQAKLMFQILEQLPLTKNAPILFLQLCEIADRIGNLNADRSFATSVDKLCLSNSQNRTVTAKTVKASFLDLGLIYE
jgi:hypothetical protein